MKIASALLVLLLFTSTVCSAGSLTAQESAAVRRVSPRGGDSTFNLKNVGNICKNTQLLPFRLFAVCQLDGARNYLKTNRLSRADRIWFENYSGELQQLMGRFDRQELTEDTAKVYFKELRLRYLKTLPDVVRREIAEKSPTRWTPTGQREESEIDRASLSYHFATQTRSARVYATREERERLCNPYVNPPWRVRALCAIAILEGVSESDEYLRKINERAAANYWQLIEALDVGRITELEALEFGRNIAREHKQGRELYASSLMQQAQQMRELLNSPPQSGRVTTTCNRVPFSITGEVTCVSE